MAIFLKKRKKLKRGNSVHKKPPPITPSKDPNVTSITTTQCKTRTDFPEITLKGNHRCSNQSKADCKNKRNGMEKLRLFLPKTIGAIISNACGGRRKALEEEPNYASDDANECMEKRETQIFNESEKLNFDESHSIFEIQVAEVDVGGRQKVDGNNCKKSSLSKFFSKRTGFNFRRFTTGYASASNGTERISGDKLGEEKDMKWEDKTLYLEKKDVEEEDNRELELCKKRILMGEKCRPLNPSGILHYDKDGILLPEDALPSEEP